MAEPALHDHHHLRNSLTTTLHITRGQGSTWQQAGGDLTQARPVAPQRQRTTRQLEADLPEVPQLW